MDAVLREAIHNTGDALSLTAAELGAEKIRERDHMQPAFRAALTGLLSETVLPHEPKLHFKHWQGIPGATVGGIDVAVADDAPHTYRAFIELKWCPLDGLFLGWAIWASSR
jgi:hypothetical protein